MRSKQEFIDFMADAGVLKFGDFTTKSGRKAPYFVNTGLFDTGMHISTLGDFYADCIMESKEKIDVLYGPAYKGITLAAAAASSLYRNYGVNIPFCFNRKEIKTYGDGGILVGYQPKDGDKIAIIEDVVTAGTAVRESIVLLRSVAEVFIKSLFVAVDRMERGKTYRAAFAELRDELGINTYSIISVNDILASLPAGSEEAAKMKEYLAKYGGHE